jgi:CBS domain containing-hemolysin-like protein
MLSYLAAVVLMLLVCLAIGWQKAYFFLPAKELKRQAEQGDATAATLWRAVAFGGSLRVFIWLIIGFGAAASFVLLGQQAPPVIALVAIVLLLWLAFGWLPYSRLHPLTVRLTVLSTPVVARLVTTFDPVFRRIDRLARTRLSLSRHTGIFERDDLIDLLEKQKAQPDSRLTLEELEIATTALAFGDKTVRSIMVPRKKVKAVNADDAISLIFLDELHKSGHSRFPVYKGKPSEFVGTLQLNQLTGVNEGKGVKGHVRDHMQHGVVYAHDKDSLAQALHAYYLTKHSMFVVIDKFEDYVGLLTVDDMLHALLGKPAEHDFDQFDNKAAVAKKHDKKEKIVEEVIDETVPEIPEEPPTEENSPETPDEVVK